MLAALALLSACATPSAPPASSGSSGTFGASASSAPKSDFTDESELLAKARARREQEMQGEWRGQPYHALRAEYGTPRFVMSHPGNRDPGSNIVIYGMRDAISQCIDAFTLFVPQSSHEPMVADYFCR
ncbi:hypothetical protein [Noviherbaspirillum denitrificans]|uniref:Uncharacterized protein n=1 Tax=Noviherbaspirillum denitrificans TaxID=1968433 RepID=A0A254T826_9BURK|nr:hypothetical protein [Noviherbaspirillum denitrificans]OWW18796.1 hypothetical protein AYR66_04370 [Noviherbaspirillum denitrificans]